VLASAFSRTADEMRGRAIWLQFATWILLALEFALAADLVRTAVAPTWDDISKLAVIAPSAPCSTISLPRISPISARPSSRPELRPRG
jgi:hypothetical protein